MDNTPGSGIGGLIFVLLLIALYFAPTFIAFARGKRNTTPILLVNFFFGWTVVGWIWALIASLSTQAVDLMPDYRQNRVDYWNRGGEMPSNQFTVLTLNDPSSIRRPSESPARVLNKPPVVATYPGWCAQCRSPIHTGNTIRIVTYPDKPDAIFAVHSECDIPVGAKEV